MKLRAYEQADAGIICQWLKSEKELYQWSADRFNKFPLTAQDINENYAPQIRTGRFFPLTALDEENHVIGHFIIRYPREDDNASVRLGFVILNPAYRGKGCGKEMLRLGVRYAKEHLHAARVDLGVFANNDSAPPKHCYEAVGFREFSRRECELPISVWECIDMELYPERARE